MDLYWRFVAHLGMHEKWFEDRIGSKGRPNLKPLPGLTLYQFQFSSNCLRVRRAMRKLGISIEMKDILEDSVAYQELMSGGRRDMVPCLKIVDHSGTRFMYESRDIIRYLAAKATPQTGL